MSRKEVYKSILKAEYASLLKELSEMKSDTGIATLQDVYETTQAINDIQKQLDELDNDTSS